MGLDNVLADLESENYRTRAFVIPACAVQAPHRRDRVWVVANAKQSSGGQCKKKNKARNRKPRTHADAVLSLRDAPNNGSERKQRMYEKAILGQQTFSWCENVRSPKDYFGRPDIPEPLVCRNNDGVSERLHALGNAVVPQIPEIIGRAILEAEQALKGTDDE